MWVTLGKQLLKAGVKKVAKDRILNRKKKTKKKASGKEVSEGIMNKGKDEKGGALAVRPTTPLVHSAKDFDPVSTTPGESDILIIKKQVIQVRDILKDTHSAKQAERVSQKKATQGEKRKDREDKIEKSKVEPTKPKTGIKMPKMGANIGNFFAWLAFGVILNKLWKFLPELIKVGRILKPIAQFIGVVIEKTFGLIVGSIELAYAGVDKLRDLIVGIGGEGAGELFDKFGRLFTMVMNGALIAATIGALIGNRRRGPRIKGPKSKWRKGIERWFKKTPVGKVLRNRKAQLLKGLRKFGKTGLGKTLTALRPKNIGRFIMEGGIDKTLKNVGGKLLKNVKQLKNVRQLDLPSVKSLKDRLPKIEIPKIKMPKIEMPSLKSLKDRLPKIELKKGKAGSSLLDRMRSIDVGKRLKQAKGLAIKGKDFALTKSKEGIDYGIKVADEARKRMNKYLDELGQSVVNALKSVKWGELPLVKQVRGAYKWATEGMSKWIDEVGKNLDPGKMVQGLIDKVKPSIDDFLKNNPALKQLGAAKIDSKTFVPWIAENYNKFKNQTEPIAKAVKGNKALKSMSNFLGPLDIVVDSMFALVDYGMGKESLVNAVVKALSSSLGFAAGAAAGTALTGTATFFTAGVGAPLIPLVTFGMGMGGALLGEQLGNLFLKALVPVLGGIDDPISEELGLGPRKIIRDPWGSVEGEDGNLKKSEIISSSSDSASGLQEHTTYSQGSHVVAENTTTYIQPIEV